MTDKPKKPTTPGMAGVSAKFVHEAEAAVAATPSTDEALSALWQEHERLRAQYSEAGRETDLAFTAEKAITETETPEYRIAAAAHEAADRHQQETSDAIVATHNRMAKMPARTIAGALSKLRVIGVDIADEFKGHDGVLDETLLGSVERLTLSALADLERLGGVTATPPSSASLSDDPLVALGEQWQEACRNLQAAPREGESHEESLALEKRADELAKIVYELEDQAAGIPAQSIEGVLAQLRMAGTHYHLMNRSIEEWSDKYAQLTWQASDGLERVAGEAVSIDYASATEDPVLALKREWEARYKALDEDRDDPDTDDSDKAMQPFYDRLHETEVQILRTQATTPAGVAIKLILWARLHCTADEVLGLSWTRKSIEGYPHDLDQLPVLSALLDLERMSSGTMAPEAPAVPVIDEPLLALERRWREAMQACQEAGTDTKEGYEAQIIEVQDKIVATPARSIAGVLAKLSFYASHERPHTPPIDQQPFDALDVDQAAVVGAIRDLERLAGTTTVAETPRAEDTALFDAIAEYDRLAAIDKDLNYRIGILRPGIPEADEATKAYQAACDETLKAWKTTQGIPATTQAGLLARLQATDRYMTDLAVDEVYNDDWLIIKADVLRITESAPS